MLTVERKVNYNKEHKIKYRVEEYYGKTDEKTFEFL